MKLYCVTKNTINILNINKVKDNNNLSNKEIVTEFLHKKNKNKGKKTSIQILCNKDDNNYLTWILFYKLPSNKLSIDTEMVFNFNNQEIKAYNGIIILFTMKTDNSINIIFH